MDTFREAFRIFNVGLRDSKDFCDVKLRGLPWYRFLDRAHYEAMSALLNEVAGAGKQIWVATEMQRIALEAQGNADQEQ